VAREAVSRRDALRASARQGWTQAEALHSHRYVYDEPAVERRQRSGSSNAFPAGVRSPPLRGRLSKLGWLSGENPGITRKVVFSEGRTPCVRIPMLHATRGIT
jgi:hypothetical protein